MRMLSSPLGWIRQTGRFYPRTGDAWKNRALTGDLLQNVEEASHVLFRIVEVGRDAHARATHADEDVVAHEPGGEVGRGARPEHQADHVPRPSLFRHPRDTAFFCLLFYEISQHADGLGDVLDPPVEELAQCFGGHGEQDEVAPLSHVVAAGTWLEGVLVVHEFRELLASTAVDPVVLYGLPLAVLFVDIHEPYPVRPEQPLVRGSDQEVRPDLRNVKRKSTQRLYAIDDQRRSRFPDLLADASEVYERAVGPVAVWRRDHGGVAIDFFDQNPCPVGVFRAGHGDELRPFARG